MIQHKIMYFTTGVALCLLLCCCSAMPAVFPSLYGPLSFISKNEDRLIKNNVPFPSGTVTTSIVGFFNTSIIECPSCYETGPFLIPYGDRQFDVRLTNNTLLVVEIISVLDDDQPTVRLDASIPFADPNCRPSHLARSAYNNENFYVVFHNCPTWSPRRDQNGAISPPPSTQNTNVRPGTVGNDSNDDYFITSAVNVITITQVSDNIEPVDIRPAADQCVEYTNVYPLHTPLSANDELINFILECTTSDQSSKLFTVDYDVFFDELFENELRGISGVPLSFEGSDYIAFRHNSELIIVNHSDLNQSPGRRTFTGRIEAMYFYQVGSTTWLTVVIPNHNLFIIKVDEFVTTRGGDSSVYEIPNTNAGSCDPTCLPQRLITTERLMVAVQNAQSSYDFVAVNLNTSAPSEISRVERISDRPAFLVQFEEGVAPTVTPDTMTTTKPETEEPFSTEVPNTTEEPVTTEKPTTSEEPSMTTLVHTDHPTSVLLVHIVAPVAAVCGGIVLALVFAIITGVVCLLRTNRKVKRSVMTPISECGTNNTSASSLSERSSLSSASDEVEYKIRPPMQETTRV